MLLSHFHHFNRDLMSFLLFSYAYKKYTLIHFLLFQCIISIHDYHVLILNGPDQATLWMEIDNTNNDMVICITF